MNIRGYSVCSAGMGVDAVRRRAVEREREAARADLRVWPAPEVACRPAVEGEFSKTSRAARAAAQASGWTVVATYARGNRVARGNRPGIVVDSLALRMRRGPTYVVACWSNGSFDMAVQANPLRLLGYRELLAMLTETC